jgi:hypothetical protein
MLTLFHGHVSVVGCVCDFGLYSFMVVSLFLSKFYLTWPLCISRLIMVVSLFSPFSAPSFP